MPSTLSPEMVMPFAQSALNRGIDESTEGALWRVGAVVEKTPKMDDDFLRFADGQFSPHLGRLGLESTPSANTIPVSTIVGEKDGHSVYTSGHVPQLESKPPVAVSSDARTTPKDMATRQESKAPSRFRRIAGRFALATSLAIPGGIMADAVRAESAEAAEYVCATEHDGGNTLIWGNCSRNVEAMQHRLEELNYLPVGTANGAFGDITGGGLIRAQTCNRTLADMQYGPATRRILNSPNAVKAGDCAATTASTQEQAGRQGSAATVPAERVMTSGGMTLEFKTDVSQEKNGLTVIGVKVGLKKPGKRQDFDGDFSVASEGPKLLGIDTEWPSGCHPALKNDGEGTPQSVHIHVDGAASSDCKTRLTYSGSGKINIGGVEAVIRESNVKPGPSSPVNCVPGLDANCGPKTPSTTAKDSSVAAKAGEIVGRTANGGFKMIKWGVEQAASFVGAGARFIRF